MLLQIIGDMGNHWGNIGAILGFNRDHIRVILGLYWGYLGGLLG